MLTLIAVAKQLLLPPLSLTILALAGLAFERRWPRAGRTMAITSLLAMYAMSTSIVAETLIRSIQEGNSTDRTGQAIAVLSAGTLPVASDYGVTTADALTLERLRYAARLERQTRLPILVSGGKLKADEPPIADIMNQILVTEYASRPAWLERESYNTATNASYSAAILKQHGITRIYLVTHAWHMRRARLAFEHEGLTVLAAGTGQCPPLNGLELSDILPSIRAFNRSYYAMYELIGLAEYSLAM